MALSQEDQAAMIIRAVTAIRNDDYVSRIDNETLRQNRYRVILKPIAEDYKITVKELAKILADKLAGKKAPSQENVSHTPVI